MQKPKVVRIIDVQAMMNFQLCKKIGPFAAKLGGDIDPKSFDSDIVDTPVS